MFPLRPSTRDEFRIAIICALPEERDAVEAVMTTVFHGENGYSKMDGDKNHYTTGIVGGKPVVLVCLRDMGTLNAADSARMMSFSFRLITYALVVGIIGGAPFNTDKTLTDIQLGDVIISTQVIQYDFGKQHEDMFERKTEHETVLSRAPTEVTSLLKVLETRESNAFHRVLQKTNANLAACGELSAVAYQHPGEGMDHVYAADHRHKHRKISPVPAAKTGLLPYLNGLLWSKSHPAPDQHVGDECKTCSECTEWNHEVCANARNARCKDLGCQPLSSRPVREARVHFGRVASGDGVMKSAHTRDQIVARDNVIGFEMEGAGVWEVFGTIVVKGVVDYADSHKNKDWRKYPAARAALCAKALIEEIELPERTEAEKSRADDANPVLAKPMSGLQSAGWYNYGDSKVLNQGNQTFHGNQTFSF